MTQNLPPSTTTALAEPFAKTSAAAAAELSLSPDAQAQRRAELLALLSQTVPEVMADQQVNIDRLKELLGHERIAPDEHYELNWAGKNAARREIQKSTTHTLQPAAGNPAQAQHMLIEGENLEVLRVLQKSYYGKVKMIYIDPPYNTGNDSFVYPDDYSETLDAYQKRTGEKSETGHLNKQSLWKKNSKESGQYHSSWLSMMYPRMYLARNLLMDDGVIAIHIDEHEYSNLETLMNEIFGEENNIGTLVWDKRNPKGDSKGIANQHEYLIFFTKNKDLFFKSCEFVRPKLNADKVLKVAAQICKETGVNENSREAFKQWMKTAPDLSGGERAYCLIDEDGEVYRPVSMSWPNKQQAPDDYFIPLIHPKTNKPCPVPARGWRNPSSTMSELLRQKRILFGPDEKTQPTRKYLLKENLDENISSLLYFGGSDDGLLKSMDIPFENPKVVEVAKRLLSPALKKEDLVLDFFAGSGTTAHAIMELNLEDGGNRQCISVQMPEALDVSSAACKAGYHTIADITRARIEKVITKLKAEYPEKTADLACAHFTLAPSNFQVWRGNVSDADTLRDQLALFQSAEKKSKTTKDGDSQTEMLAELLLKHGLGALGVHAISKPKVLAGITVHRVLMPDDKQLWLCFEPYTEALKDEIVKARPAQVTLLSSCFVGDKADELLANLQLELAGLDIGLTVI